MPHAVLLVNPLLATMLSAIAFSISHHWQILQQKRNRWTLFHPCQGHALLTCLLPQLFQAAWLPLMWGSWRLRPILALMRLKQCTFANVPRENQYGPNWSNRTYPTSPSSGQRMGDLTPRLWMLSKALRRELRDEGDADRHRSCRRCSHRSARASLDAWHECPCRAGPRTMTQTISLHRRSRPHWTVFLPMRLAKPEECSPRVCVMFS